MFQTFMAEFLSRVMELLDIDKRLLLETQIEGYRSQMEDNSVALEEANEQRAQLEGKVNDLALRVKELSKTQLFTDTAMN